MSKPGGRKRGNERRGRRQQASVVQHSGLTRDSGPTLPGRLARGEAYNADPDGIRGAWKRLLGHKTRGSRGGLPPARSRKHRGGRS